MAIRIRRGTDAQRAVTTFLDGEIIWTTDTFKFYVGDGVTVGGVLIGPISSSGITSVNTDIGPAVSLTVINSGTGGTLQWNTTQLQIPESASTKTGLLSSTDWTTFNNKQNALSFGNITESTSSILTITGGVGAVIGGGVSIQVAQATSIQSGYLSFADWNTFNAKQPAGSYITALTGDVTASGPGSSSATIANNAVTFAKIQNLSGPSILMGRYSAGPGNVEEITLGSGISMSLSGVLSSTGSGGTVTSVSLSLPTEFSVSGSPVTGSGTLTGSWANQSANTVFSGPSSGPAGTPSFRALVSADIPDISATYLTVANAALNYQPLDSDLTSIAGLTPSDDDIIQRKSGAWTNRTIAQYYADLLTSVKNDVYFVVPFLPGALSPADSTSYYFGGAAIAPSTTDTNQDISFGYDFTVIGAVIMVGANTASGTTEDSTLQLRNITSGTSTTIGTFKTNGSTTVNITTTITGLTINVNAADSFCLRWNTPAYVTNPTGCSVRVNLICKRR